MGRAAQGSSALSRGQVQACLCICSLVAPSLRTRHHAEVEIPSSSQPFDQPAPATATKRRTPPPRAHQERDPEEDVAEVAEREDGEPTFRRPRCLNSPSLGAHQRGARLKPQRRVPRNALSIKRWDESKATRPMQPAEHAAPRHAAATTLPRKATKNCM